MQIAENMQQEAGLPVVLLVEDNPDDVLLTRRAVRKAGLQVSLFIVNDGDQAIGYLDSAARNSGPQRVPIPSLILLDLKLPKRSGFEVLGWIRERPSFATVPVVVLTSSTEEPDIKMAYERGANSYLRKPVVFNDFVKMLNVIGVYWFDTNLTAPYPAVTR